MTDMTEMSLEYRVREETEIRERPGPTAAGGTSDIAALSADEAPELGDADAVDVAVSPTTRTPGRTFREEPRSPDLMATYFRQMGRAEMITREQEVALAKRIEAAQQALVAGLCRVPMLIERIDRWGAELRDNRLRLRDLVDLPAAGNEPLPGAGEIAAPRRPLVAAEVVEETEEQSASSDDHSDFAAREQALLPAVLARLGAMSTLAGEITTLSQKRVAAVARGRDILKARRARLGALIARFGGEAAQLRLRASAPHRS
jgi:hypothetical protein